MIAINKRTTITKATEFQDERMYKNTGYTKNDMNIYTKDTTYTKYELWNRDK